MVFIPILNESVSSGISVVLNPDITTLSPLLSDGDVEINAEICSSSFSIKTTFSYVSIVVLIDVISFPKTLSTEALNPPPSVLVLSNITEFPTL